MDHFTRDGGLTTKLMVKVDLSTQMVMCTMDSGKMIRLTDMESIVIWMEQSTKATGKKTSNTATVLKLGQMALDMRVSTLLARNTVLVDSLGLTEAHFTVSLMIII